MNAMSAVDFKNGFGSQFNGLIGQPFAAADTDSLYSSAYSSYNNWATKVPSPLGAKSFPWSVNPLSQAVNHHHHHHQPAVNCFAPTAAGAASTMSSMSAAAAAAAMLPSGGMSPSSLGATGAGGVGVGVSAGSTAASCPYAASPTTHYGVGVYHHPHHHHHHHKAVVAAAAVVDSSSSSSSASVMSSSIASLRLKAKQHSSTFGYPISPIGGGGGGGGGGSRPSSSGGLSACQYATSDSDENRTPV